LKYEKKGEGTKSPPRKKGKFLVSARRKKKMRGEEGR